MTAPQYQAGPVCADLADGLCPHQTRVEQTRVEQGKAQYRDPSKGTRICHVAIRLHWIFAADVVRLIEDDRSRADVG